MPKGKIVVLADGHNGHTAQFYVDPIEVDGNMVKLRCAEPGKEHMISWRERAVVDAAIASQNVRKETPRDVAPAAREASFAERLGLAFPGFVDDDDVGGSDLVDWIAENKKALKSDLGAEGYSLFLDAFPGFRRGSDVNGGDLVEWIAEHYESDFERISLAVGLWPEAQVPDPAYVND